MGERIPDGFQASERKSIHIVARPEILSDIEAAVANGSLYDFAQKQSDVRAFKGRGDAYAFRSASDIPIVVRRSRHGGALAPVTGELFFTPGRAPQELKISLALLERDVPTAEFLAYIRYRAGIVFCRTDVVTRFVTDTLDLATVLREERDPKRRSNAIAASAKLLRQMAHARARHPDLNLRNILVRPSEISAWVLDVDRVELDQASVGQIGEANLARLLRSARKLESIFKMTMLGSDEIAILSASVSR